MTPQERMKKVIQAEASRSSSDFEDILHRGTTKRAKVEFGDFRKATRGKFLDNLSTTFDYSNNGNIYSRSRFERN